MSFEKYDQLLKRNRNDDITLKTGKSFSLDFDLTEPEAVDRLFFTGEVGVFYGWKTEPDYQYLYRRIDDSLSTAEAEKSQYALDMSAENYNYPKIAYRKQLWWPRFYGGGSKWQFGLSVKAEDLVIHEGGYLHFLIEVRYRKDGVDNRLTYTEPDVTAVIDIPEGSYPYTKLAENVDFSSNVASVCVYLEGMHYSGKVFCEEPYLHSECPENLLPQFTTFTEDRSDFNWLGVNLSKKETPTFKIELNGETIHDGEIFERCHRYSEWEVTIPRGVAKKGRNTVKFTHTSSYRDAAPYNIHEIGLVSVRRDALIACPEVVTVGKEFSVLVKTERDGDSFSLVASPAYLRATKLDCAEAGLNVLKFVCDEPTNDISFTLSHGGERIECKVSRAVIKNEDSVWTGTGDAVYINQNDTDFENYLSWYVSNDIGELITFRPTYRWSGSKAADGKLWKKTSALLNELGMKYVHMVDGRELPGCSSNPRRDELAGEGFFGRQAHELDGSFVYWGYRNIGNNVNEQMFYDLFIREFLKDRERTKARFCPRNYVATGGNLGLYRDLTVKRDMEAASDYVVNTLANTRYTATRHTGPTALFKYFYQAGYSWTGAELMYSATEPTCAALRGAASVYGGNIGAHHAVQWSSTPHNSIGHYKRYRMALYTTYMQGINEINTEEGLWRMEEYFSDHHRYTPACLSHLKEHQDFNRYVKTHTRSGKFHTPVAFLHGRYDSWCIFAGRSSVWGMPGAPYCDPENSWDLLTVFYPKSVQQAIYRHPCPENISVGYYTGTPRGNVDVYPMEAEDYSAYPLAMMLGYNKAMAEDMDKLDRFVRGGGTLFIGLPQLSVTTFRADIENYRLIYIDHPFRDSVAPEIEFVEDTLDGNPLRVNKHIPAGAEVIVKSDGGYPVICSIALGKGRVYLLNTLEYAAAKALQAPVSAIMAELADRQVAQENVWAECDDEVQFAVYKQDNGDTHVYFLSIDWYDAAEPNHRVFLRIGEKKYPVDISYGRMLKANVSGDVAAWFDCEECDVLEIVDGAVKAQGCGKANLYIAKNGERREVEVDFTDSSVIEVKI